MTDLPSLVSAGSSTSTERVAPCPPTEPVAWVCVANRGSFAPRYLVWSKGETVGLARADQCYYEPLYAVPYAAGWKLIPVEPTAPMLAAGVLHDSGDDCSDIGADIDGIYRAMLYAAPSAAPDNGIPIKPVPVLECPSCNFRWLAGAFEPAAVAMPGEAQIERAQPAVPGAELLPGLREALLFKPNTPQLENAMTYAWTRALETLIRSLAAAPGGEK